MMSRGRGRRGSSSLTDARADNAQMARRSIPVYQLQDPDTDTPDFHLIERPDHIVELVLRRHDDLVKARLDRPQLLLFGERAEKPLAPPVAPCAADSALQHPAAVKLHLVAQMRSTTAYARFAARSETRRASRDTSRPSHGAAIACAQSA
jgi:hypothetical protein